MKISKRLLFFVCLVFISESVAMKKEPAFKKIDPALEEQLKPIFAKLLRVEPNSEEIGRILDYGPLCSNMPGNNARSNIRLLLNDNDTAEYVEKIATGANKAHVYQVAVTSKTEKTLKLYEYTIIDFRLLDTVLSAKIEAIERPLLEEIHKLEEEANQSLDRELKREYEIKALLQGDADKKEGNKEIKDLGVRIKDLEGCSIIEKHPYIFCGLGMLVGGLLVAFGLRMQQAHLEPAFSK